MVKRKLNFSNLSLLLVGSIVVFACQSSPKESVASSAPTSETTSGEEKQLDRVLKTGVNKPEETTFETEISASKAADGSLVRVTLRTGSETKPSGMRAVFEGTQFPVVPRSLTDENSEYDALIVIPFNSKPRNSVIELTWNETEGGVRKPKGVSLPIEVVDGNYRSEKLTVDKKKIDPPKKVLNRIIREQRQIGAVYRKIDTKKLWNGPFTLPLDSEITSPFGNKRLYNGKMNGFHQGLDLRARTPLPILAPADGRVAIAKDLYFTGGTVILDHGHGLFTIYAHMSRIDVKVDDIVKKGGALGLTGATGRASGPHLHWGAVLNRQKFNPQDLQRVIR